MAKVENACSSALAYLSRANAKMEEDCDPKKLSKAPTGQTALCEISKDNAEKAEKTADALCPGVY